MIDRKVARIRRLKKLRAKVKKARDLADVVRLCIYRSSANIYAQVIDAKGNVLVTASTLDEEVAKKVPYGGNVKAAAAVGKCIAERFNKKNIEKRVVFDRSGFRFHGRVKALAEAAREAGIKF